MTNHSLRETEDPTTTDELQRPFPAAVTRSPFDRDRQVRATDGKHGDSRKCYRDNAGPFPPGV